MRIVIGSEHAGAVYRARFAEELCRRGHEVVEIYENDSLCGYPAVAEKVCSIVMEDNAELGILICGTGIGMAMAAGKVPGIRAALCPDAFMAKMAKKHNNANVLVFGSRVIAYESMLFCFDIFMEETYEGGRHNARLQALHELEEKYSKRGMVI